MRLGYGKAAVAVYRTGARERLFAAEIRMEVDGAAFAASYVEGDNTLVVATDSMKNFVHRAVADYDGSSLEELLELVGSRFLERYGHVERVRLRARELRFAPVGTVSFQRLYDDYGVAELELDRGGPVLQRSGREGLHLVKLTGSSFAGFVRDEYTLLPETADRPLFVHLDVHWRQGDTRQRVPGERVRAALLRTFDSFESNSIQHLVHELGRVLLAEFPQLDEVSFVAENRLWDRAQVPEHGGEARVYCDPRPPYGVITLTLAR